MSFELVNCINSAPLNSLCVQYKDQLMWAEAFKFATPLIIAIVMVWVKGWIETRISRRNKQHALSRLLHNELHAAESTVKVLKRIATSATDGNLRLVAVDLSSMVPKLSCDLVDLDPGQAYLYAELASCVELVNKGLTRLTAFTSSRAGASTQAISEQLDDAIIGQSRITAGDYIVMSKAALDVLKAIPEKHRFSADPQYMKTMEQMIASVDKDLGEWPIRASPPPQKPSPSSLRLKFQRLFRRLTPGSKPEPS